MLSILWVLELITHDVKKSKLTVTKLYDSTKGGTDILDQLNGYYTCQSGTSL